jgi:hypothetical protein
MQDIDKDIAILRLEYDISAYSVQIFDAKRKILESIKAKMTQEEKVAELDFKLKELKIKIEELKNT